MVPPAVASCAGGCSTFDTKFHAAHDSSAGPPTGGCPNGSFAGWGDHRFLRRFLRRFLHRSFIDLSATVLPPFCDPLAIPQLSNSWASTSSAPLPATFRGKSRSPRKNHPPALTRPLSPCRYHPANLTRQKSRGRHHEADITRQTSRGGHGPKRPWGQPRAKCASINSFPIASFAAKLLWARQSSRKFPKVFCPPNARGVT